MHETEPISFWDFIRQAELRFYQERDLGLDLYHSGAPGIVLVVFAIASATVFLLAIFHVIPSRRHVVSLLLSLGILAALTGWATTYWNVNHLAEVQEEIVRTSAGPAPASHEQLAAVLALPLVVGVLTFSFALGGCIYMAIFWVTYRKERR